jgi:endonuclease III
MASESAPATETAEAAPAVPPEQPAVPETAPTASEGAPAAGDATAAPAAPTETQVATAPAIHIWLSSQKSREQAERGWQELKTAYPDLLDQLELTVREVDLGANKGVWYRVYAGPLASRQDAKDLCAKIKAQPPNSNCLVATD